MRIQIDTGSRLDESGDTTFGFSDDIQKAIRLKQRVRDQCLQALKGRRLSKELRLLAACVYLLIEDYLEDLESIVIDNEYEGYQGDIKRYLLNLIKTHTDAHFPEARIQVVSIGKKSAAHEVAYQTLIKKRKADRVLRVREILELLIPKWKKAGGFPGLR